jgi:hypothetical protein
MRMHIHNIARADSYQFCFHNAVRNFSDSRLYTLACFNLILFFISRESEEFPVGFTDLWSLKVFITKSFVYRKACFFLIINYSHKTSVVQAVFWKLLIIERWSLCVCDKYKRKNNRRRDTVGKVSQKISRA